MLHIICLILGMGLPSELAKLQSGFVEMLVCAHGFDDLELGSGC
jgi:hypothetical protein